MTKARTKTKVEKKETIVTRSSTNYRILMPFTYRGPGGNWKHAQHVRLGPGQEFPKLESSEIERLLHEGKICEMGSDGTSIPNKRFEDMNAEQIDRLFGAKSELAILNIINSTNFSTDTLNRMLVYSQKNKLNQTAHILESKLDGLLAA